ncbi:OmpA family protein [Burkholderia ubonensis]|uniref:OmpA family protein n=1 Tax=Burkholderia ubonensis TaxID=101571 RepID=UPI0009B3FCCE|nr:OmpA family protein [Burkholderia ubonensis]
MFKKLILLTSVLVLSACASHGNNLTTSVSEFVPARGHSIYEVECAGVFGSSKQCRDRAKEICQKKNVEWVMAAKAPNNDPKAIGTSQKMQFRCVDEVPVAAAAPAAPVAPTPPRIEKITLSSTQLFDFNSVKLRLPQPELDQFASAMADNPQVRDVVISGYTDRLGSAKYNQQLSQRRAEAVKAYMVSRGIDAGRLTPVGKGMADPVIQCKEKDRARLIKCLEPNRRVEIAPVTITKTM